VLALLVCRHFAFSFVSARRNKPLNLAAESEPVMREWIAALNRALATAERENKADIMAAAAAASGSAAAGGKGDAKGDGKSGGTGTTATAAVASARAPESEYSSTAAAQALAAAGGAMTGVGGAAVGTISVVGNTGQVQPHVSTTVDGVLHLEGWLLKEDPVRARARARTC
jgi:hypothetical protein